jgi:Tfp pilus assembly protein PilF
MAVAETMLSGLLAALMLSSSAASSPPLPPSAVALPPPVVVAVADPIPQVDVMSLPPELRAQADAVIRAGDPGATQRFQRLMNFIVDEHGLGMTYQEDATYTVAQAYATRKANCLTFTLLVIALANEAGLEAYPQEVGETLSWREVDGTIYRDNHINAGVRIGTHRFTVDPAADLVFLPRAPVVVSHERLLAHYYNNVAVDRLQQRNLDAAQRDMAVALQLDPGYAALWSNAGVMYLHNGDSKAAADAYSRALALNPSDASALFNMVQLLHSQASPREIEFRQRLSRVEQRDPLQQFLQGLDYERSGNFPRAIASVRRAIQLKSDEHRFYAALARLYQRVGDFTRARSALASAQGLSRGKTQEMYRAERDRLRDMTEHNKPLGPGGG